MNVAITRLSQLGKQDYIAVYCGNPKCRKHSMGTLLDIPATIREYGDLPLMELCARFRCKDCGHQPAEVRHGYAVTTGRAEGWAGLKNG